jgi:hypothetical protein
MINTRSTYYRSVGFVSPLTGATCTEYKLNIYIWTGLQTSVPGTETYSITRKNYESSTGAEDVEIGRLIRSYIELNLTNVTIGTNYINQNSSNQTWVKTSVEYTTGNGSDTGVEQSEITLLALGGYGYGNEGLNPQIPSNGILITNNIFRVSRNSLFTIPVYCDSSKSVVITAPNGTYSNSYTIPSSTNSDSIIQLIIIDTSTISDFENRVTVSIDSNDIILLFDNDERYENTDLFFINKNGGQQTVSMRKERTEGMRVRRENYERSFNQPSDGYHQIVDYLINGKTTITLNSGYVPESDNDSFKELLLSDRVWMRYDGNTIPVNMSVQNIDYKTRSVDKLVNYEIQVSHAYNEINTI